MRVGGTEKPFVKMNIPVASRNATTRAPHTSYVSSIDPFQALISIPNHLQPYSLPDRTEMQVASLHSDSLVVMIP